MGSSSVYVLFGCLGLAAYRSQGWALVHLPVCEVVNAAFTRFVAEQPPEQAFRMLMAWMASLTVGIAFYRWVELPFSRFLTSFTPSETPRPFWKTKQDCKAEQLQS